MSRQPELRRCEIDRRGIEKVLVPAASTASRKAILLWVEQLSSIMILFGPGYAFILGNYNNVH